MYNDINLFLIIKYLSIIFDKYFQNYKIIFF